MGFKTGVAVGLAVGYWFGTKAGEERHAQLERWVRPVLESDAADRARDLASDLLRDFVDATRQALKDATAPDATVLDLKRTG